MERHGSMCASRDLGYPVWTPEIGGRLAEQVIVRMELVPKPARHYRLTFASGEVVAFTDSPSKVVNETEAKPALTWWSAGLAAEYLLDNIGPLTLDFHAGTADWNTKRLAWYTEARKQHDEHKKQAATTGSAVHDLIERTLKATFCGGLAPVPPTDTPAAVLAGLAAFTAWWQSQGLHAVGIEQPIAHPLMGYAGTIDVVAIDSMGTARLVDWKTSNALRSSYLRQCGAYTLAYNWTYPDDRIDDVHLIRLGKEGVDAGQFEAVHLDEDQVREAERAFADSLRLYRYTRDADARLKAHTKETHHAPVPSR